MPSRRTFLTQTAAIVCGSQVTRAKDSLTRKNLGVQLYTVRNIILKDPAGVFASIENIGYTEVEATYATLNQIWPALKNTQLRPVSVHVDKAILEGDADHLNATIEDVKQRGFEYIVLASFPTAEGGADGVKRAADMMNKAGEKARASGLTFCYHNHAHDLQPINGTPALELLMNETQKNLVLLEMDIFWVSVAGHNPAKLLKQYSGRVPIIHLKDKAEGVPVQYKEDVAHDAFKEVGSGTIDIPAVLSAAGPAGVRHYFVEQDQTPGDPIASLRQSYTYLQSQFKT